jgi:ABC-type multidrug transport system fused ATPase/permease subunit
MISAIKTSLTFLSRRQRLIYWALVGVKALSGILDIFGIVLIGLITGIAASNLVPGESLSILGFQLPSVTQETLVILVLAVLLVFALKAVIAILLAKAIAVFLARVESERAAEIASYLLSGNLSSLQRFTKGEIAWAAMGSATTGFSGLLTSLSTFVSEGTLLILITVTFFLVDPVASLFVMGYFIGIIGIIQLIISKALKQAGTDAAEGNSESMLILQDTVGAFREITVLDKQQFFVSKFHKSRHRMASSAGTVTFLAGMPRYVVETALMLGVVIFVGFQFLTGQLATGLVTVGVFLTGGVRIMGSLLPLQSAIANVKVQAEQAILAHKLLREARAVQSLPEMTAHDNVGSRSADGQLKKGLHVTMENVSFTYPGSPSPAIDNVSLEIPGGKHVAFIGPSGAGKTTVVDLILGLMTPSSGTLLVEGEPVHHRSLIENRLVSYVPQNPGIVSGSIAENVALGIELKNIDAERVLEALEIAHLGEFVSSLPEGIFTSVGAQADSLSGGQIQRLGLARALYTKPKLIVLDEATSALDASSEAYISESIKELGDDVTVIVIAHRLSTVQHSDIVFLIKDGRIEASGSFAHLRKTVPLVAEYVKLMSFEESSN